jgi:hypothetical protein
MLIRKFIGALLVVDSVKNLKNAVDDILRAICQLESAIFERGSRGGKVDSFRSTKRGQKRCKIGRLFDLRSLVVFRVFERLVERDDKAFGGRMTQRTFRTFAFHSKRTKIGRMEKTTSRVLV